MPRLLPRADPRRSVASLHRLARKDTTESSAHETSWMELGAVTASSRDIGGSRRVPVPPRHSRVKREGRPTLHSSENAPGAAQRAFGALRGTLLSFFPQFSPQFSPQFRRTGGWVIQGVWAKKCERSIWHGATRSNRSNTPLCTPLFECRIALIAISTLSSFSPILGQLRNGASCLGGRTAPPLSKFGHRTFRDS